MVFFAVAEGAFEVFEVFFLDAEGVELAVEDVFAFLEALFLLAHVLTLGVDFLFGDFLDFEVFGFAIDFGLFDDFGGLGLGLGDGRGSLGLSPFQDGTGHILNDEKRNDETDDGSDDGTQANTQGVNFGQREDGMQQGERDHF